MHLAVHVMMVATCAFVAHADGAGIALHRKQGHRGYSRETLLQRHLAGIQGVPMGGSTGKDGEYFVPFYLLLPIQLP